MEYRSLGRSGLKVPELCFGTGTFGAGNEFFNKSCRQIHRIDFCFSIRCQAQAASFDRGFFEENDEGNGLFSGFASNYGSD